MTDIRCMLLKGSQQLLPILLLGTCLMLVHFLMVQHQPGFVVGDSSLSYPIVTETLSTMAAGGIMFLYPFVAVTLRCIVIWRLRESKITAILVYWWEKTWCAMFVALVFLLFSEFMKRFVGKLRPNFFAMCNPTYDINEAMIVDVDRNYVGEGNYSCQDEVKVGEAARSFPSGHSMCAILLFSATGLLLNTHNTNPNDPSWSTRLLIQGILTLIVGPWIALTRYTEYYHHWSDVLVGIVLGFLAFICLLLLERAVVKQPSSTAPQKDFSEIDRQLEVTDQQHAL